MPRTQLNVQLIRMTPEPQELCALAARLCYAKADVAALRERIGEKDQAAFLRGVIESGHHSVLEHAAFTFAAEGVSRVLLAQLTRHRIASFSVQSQRYVSLAEGFSYILPPAIQALGEDAVREYESQMNTMHAWYLGWQARLEKGENGNQDARFVLPNACETRIVMTMNARELRHFFALRCCRRAQWEIRALATEMLRLCRAAAPVLFEDAGPACLSGVCPEGRRSCGQAAEVRRQFAAL